jgi:hypothetical protein
VNKKCHKKPKSFTPRVKGGTNQIMVTWQVETNQRTAQARLGVASLKLTKRVKLQIERVLVAERKTHKIK